MEPQKKSRFLKLIHRKSMKVLALFLAAVAGTLPVRPDIILGIIEQYFTPNEEQSNPSVISIDTNINSNNNVNNLSGNNIVNSFNSNNNNVNNLSDDDTVNSFNSNNIDIDSINFKKYDNINQFNHFIINLNSEVFNNISSDNDANFNLNSTFQAGFNSNFSLNIDPSVEAKSVISVASQDFQSGMINFEFEFINYFPHDSNNRGHDDTSMKTIENNWSFPKNETLFFTQDIIDNNIVHPSFYLCSQNQLLECDVDYLFLTDIFLNWFNVQADTTVVMIYEFPGTSRSIPEPSAKFGLLAFSVLSAASLLGHKRQ